VVTVINNLGSYSGVVKKDIKTVKSTGMCTRVKWNDRMSLQ